MEALVKFDHVSKCYANGVRALRCIDLTIKKGEFISVIGPSGAGKSTFLRSINCLNTISEGKIYLDGEEMTQKEVAAFLGISQSYISRLEKKIMKQLKKEMSSLV